MIILPEGVTSIKSILFYSTCLTIQWQTEFVTNIIKKLDNRLSFDEWAFQFIVGRIFERWALSAPLIPI